MTRRRLRRGKTRGSAAGTDAMHRPRFGVLPKGEGRAASLSSPAEGSGHELLKQFFVL
jgi:hypothetical protein